MSISMFRDERGGFLSLLHKGFAENITRFNLTVKERCTENEASPSLCVNPLSSGFSSSATNPPTGMFLGLSRNQGGGVVTIQFEQTKPSNSMDRSLRRI